MAEKKRIEAGTVVTWETNGAGRGTRTGRVVGFVPRRHNVLTMFPEAAAKKVDFYSDSNIDRYLVLAADIGEAEPFLTYLCPLAGTIEKAASFALKRGLTRRT